MKHLDTYQLFEKKQVGVVYHFTDPESLLGILKDDRMSSRHGHISFTRNPNLTSWYEDYGAMCRISFNGSDLSNKYKIQPYLFDPKPFKPVQDADLFDKQKKISYKERKEWYGDEREETIKQNEINNIMKYVIQIDILEPYIKVAHEKKYLAMLETEPFKSMDVKINYVQKFEPIKGQII
jgi:hypothetical protein